MSAEFDWDETPYYTEKYDIPVTMPCWLAGEDISKVLHAVDQYWHAMVMFFEWAERIDPGDYTIHIHDNPGAFWAGGALRGCWCHGWSIGHHIVLAWSWTYDEAGLPSGLAQQNPLDALSHEWMHVIVDSEFFWEDIAHQRYPAFQMILDEIGANFSPTIQLSEESIQGAREFRYVPWSIGGGPDN